MKKKFIPVNTNVKFNCCAKAGALIAKVKRGGKSIKTRMNVSGVMIAMTEGHVNPVTNIFWYKEGDGNKYGYSCDRYLAQAANHAGYKVVKVQ